MTLLQCSCGCLVFVGDMICGHHHGSERRGGNRSLEWGSEENDGSRIGGDGVCKAFKVIWIRNAYTDGTNIPIRLSIAMIRHFYCIEVGYNWSIWKAWLMLMSDHDMRRFPPKNKAIVRYVLVFWNYFISCLVYRFSSGGTSVTEFAENLSIHLDENNDGKLAQMSFSITLIMWRLSIFAVSTALAI